MYDQARRILVSAIDGTEDDDEDEYDGFSDEAQFIYGCGAAKLVIVTEFRLNRTIVYHKGVAHSCNLHEWRLSAGVLEYFVKTFPSLAHVDLSMTNLGDRDLRVLNRLPRLEELRLWGTGVTSEGIQLLETKNVRSLDLSSTRIDDACISHLCQWGDLRTLKVSETQLSAQGARIFGQFPALTNLYLDSTQLPIWSLEPLRDCRCLSYVSVRNAGFCLHEIEQLVRWIQPEVIRVGDSLSTVQRAILIDSFGVDVLD